MLEIDPEKRIDANGLNKQLTNTFKNFEFNLTSFLLDI